MIRVVFIWILLHAISAGDCLLSISHPASVTILSAFAGQDTLKESQDLYNGRVWVNRYRRIEGDQFLFINYFLPGTVTVNGKTFNNLLIRYDIYSDEIMIPVNREEILQLNKEMIDSFAISFENKVYRFTKIREDTLNELKGYVYVLYDGKSSLYVKYKKEISTNITDKSDGVFLQTHRTYLVKEGIIYPVKTKNSLYKALDANTEQIKNYIQNARLKVSKEKPESYIPVIRYYDSINQQVNIL